MTPNCSTCKGNSKQVRECLQGFEPTPRYIRKDPHYPFDGSQVTVAAPGSVATSDEEDAFLDAIADALPGCGWIGEVRAKGKFIVKVVPKEGIECSTPSP